MTQFKKIPEMEDFMKDYYSPNGWYRVTRCSTVDGALEIKDSFFRKHEEAQVAARYFRGRNFTAKVSFGKDPFYPFSTEQDHERQLIIALAKDYLERKQRAGQNS